MSSASDCFVMIQSVLDFLSTFEALLLDLSAWPNLDGYLEKHVRTR